MSGRWGMSAAQKAEAAADFERMTIARRRAPRAAKLADDIREFLTNGSPASYLITRKESEGLEWLAGQLEECGTFAYGRMVDDVDEAREAEVRERLAEFAARVK